MPPLNFPELTRDTAQVLDRMVAFAGDAAVLALDLRAKGLNVTHKGEGLGQALTEADEAISRMMTERFGPRLIEEESAARLSYAECRDMLAGHEWSYVGDPIDGTRPFSGGLAAWGTMLAACRDGWPVAGILCLPAWVDERDQLGRETRRDATRGVVLAAAEGHVWWAPTRDGRPAEPFRPFQRADRSTHHVGWLPIAAQNFTLDYGKGFFPFCESASVADFAALATARLDATTFNSSIWDVAAALPVVEALGFTLFSWPEIEPSPRHLIDMFAEDLSSGGRMWLVAKSGEQAAALAGAIRRAG